MTSTRTRKSASRKRRPTRKKKSTSRFPTGATISRIVILLVLILFFFLSIGAAGYVIFFRVVVAADLKTSRELITAFADHRNDTKFPKIAHGENA